jgi:pimeloyl-ACP methyl ester carboxylesterase
MRIPVVFLPDAIKPADVTYVPLLAALNGAVEPLLKDLELYRSWTPPAAYGLDTEVEGLRVAADRAEFPTFHLVAEGGGAAVALAFVATYPERVLSLALIEPSWIGNEEQGIVERHHARLVERALRLPPAARMRAVALLGVRDGVGLPSEPDDDPAWMAPRPAGLVALADALRAHRLDLGQLRAFRGPVYLAFGDLSHAVEGFRKRRLEQLFPHLVSEEYRGRHRSGPPHEAEPAKFARALRTLWRAAPGPMEAVAS